MESEKFTTSGDENEIKEELKEELHPPPVISRNQAYVGTRNGQKREFSFHSKGSSSKPVTKKSSEMLVPLIEPLQGP